VIGKGVRFHNQIENEKLKSQKKKKSQFEKNRLRRCLTHLEEKHQNLRSKYLALLQNDLRGNNLMNLILNDQIKTRNKHQ
jgi:hypothetical protein